MNYNTLPAIIVRKKNMDLEEVLYWKNKENKMTEGINGGCYPTYSKPEKCVCAYCLTGIIDKMQAQIDELAKRLYAYEKNQPTVKLDCSKSNAD